MPIVRLPNGSLRDEIRQPLYDTITIAAAESPVGSRVFFAAVQGKSLARTNLRQNNLLETAVSYRVQGLGIDVQNFNAANISCLPIIMENSSISLKIGEKVYWQGCMMTLAGRLDAKFAAAAAGQTTLVDRVYQRFGEVAVQSVILSGKHVVDINPLQSFDAAWNLVSSDVTAGEITAATPASNTSLKFQFSLKGLQRRPVQ